MRIATWNVNSLKVRLPRVEEWLAYAGPDVLCMQETKLSDAAFPTMAFSTLGYESFHHGQGQWNGVAILSRVGIDDPVAGFSSAPEDETAEARLVSATCSGVRVHSVYVPNGREVDSEHYAAKLVWLERLREHFTSTCEPDGLACILGDFNVAPEDRDVWDPALFKTSTHVTPRERAALAALRDAGMVDVFRALHDEDELYSYWDYRAGDFHKHRGMRIDLIYATKALADRATFTLVDRFARKGKLPSDHAPVIADFDV